MSDQPAFMPEADMIDRRIYRIRSRNLVVGAWRAETRGFIGIREKFGSLYLFEEFHSETGPPFGTAVAIEDLGQDVPESVPLAEYLPGSKGEHGVWCTEHDREVERDPETRERFHLDDGSPLEREDRTHLKNNDALFDLLRPHDARINQELVGEMRAAEINAEIDKWTPITVKEYERQQRTDVAIAYMREQRAAGATWEDIQEGYKARLRGDA